MQLTPLARYRLRLVGIITMIWVMIGFAIEINNALSYDPDLDRYFLHFPFGNNIVGHLLITAVGPFLGGIFGGGLIVFFLRDRLRRRSFVAKQVIQSVVFLALIFVLVMVVGGIQACTMNGNFLDNFVHVVFTWRVLRLLVTWFLVVVSTLLVLDVSEKYGKGILWRIISGKYHKPVTERRIFMFMDLKESTRITEQLGDERYFGLLRNVFFLVTDPVLNSEGEIYQYVGDEIILSWTPEKGFRNSNCIRCYEAIISAIRMHAGEFLRDYGLVPEFRAAIHVGNVVIGEIGVLKKDIVYSGDVLNSTSRIMQIAKEVGGSLLVTQQVRDALQSAPEYEFSFLRSIVLRGKSTETAIYRVEVGEG